MNETEKQIMASEQASRHFACNIDLYLKKKNGNYHPIGY
jgi:hypothetical protein